MVVGSQEADVGRIMVHHQPGQKVNISTNKSGMVVCACNTNSGGGIGRRIASCGQKWETLSKKITKTKRGLGAWLK
jgi:hypothetical protein